MSIKDYKRAKLVFRNTLYLYKQVTGLFYDKKDEFIKQHKNISKLFVWLPSFSFFSCSQMREKEEKEKKESRITVLIIIIIINLPFFVAYWGKVYKRYMSAKGFPKIK